MYRQNRKRLRSGKGRNSGGVALYLHDNYASSTEQIFNHNSGVIEAIGVYIAALDTIMIVIYRQPDDTVRCNRSTSREFKCLINELGACLNDLPSPVPNIMIFGDFNLPHATWDPLGWSVGAPADERKMIEDLRELALENFLIQQVEFPTHRDGNVLDIVFTNNSSLVYDICALPSKVSDHLIIEMTTTVSPLLSHKDADATSDILVNRESETEIDFRHLNFFSEDINWDAILLRLSQHNWVQELQGLNVEAMLAKFSSVCLNIAKEFTPLKKHVLGSNPKNRRFIPRHRRILMRKRRRLKVQLVKANRLLRPATIPSQGALSI